MSDSHHACDQAIIKLNDDLEIHQKAVAGLVDTLNTVAACDTGCVHCGRLASDAVEGLPLRAVPFEELIERSSFGSPAALALRAQTPPEVLERLLEALRGPGGSREDLLDATRRYLDLLAQAGSPREIQRAVDHLGQVSAWREQP